MNAIAKFTLKSLWANRVRTLVTIAGVALAAALLTAVMTSYTSLNNFLYETEKAQAGSWMVKAQSINGADLGDQVWEAKADPNVIDVACFEDVGFGEIAPAQQNVYGKYLPIASYTGDIEELCGAKLTDGRWPASADEIVLPAVWLRRGAAQIGDEFALNIGDRVAVLAPSAAESADAGEGPVMETFQESAALLEFGTFDSWTIEEGTLLDSSIGYLDAKADKGYFNEELVHLSPRTFTVVGFTELYTYALSASTGQRALIGGGLTYKGPMSAYVVMDGFDSTDQLEAEAQRLFPDDNLTYHSALLRYLGIRGNSAIWNTFFGLAAVLAVVIVIACVSLIYNAFAISVAERSNQFGLLASIGASRRQLRRAIIIEGLIVALIGIPLGLGLGIGGCAITFSFLGPMIANVLGATNVPFTTSVALWALGLASLLTLVTVMVSVFIPALRTGRIDPIQSIRQNQSEKVSKRGMRQARTAVDPAKLWKPRGFVARAFGVGGNLARINFKRSNIKGRAASLSLALAIVLLMTAGSLNLFIGELVSAVNTSAPYDIGMTVGLENDDTVTPEQFAYYDGAYEAAASVPGVEGVGWFIGSSAALVMSADMVADSFQGSKASNDQAGYRMDGTFASFGNIYYLEDALFDAYAASVGADPQDYYDPAAPQAIAIDRGYALYDGKYQVVNTFAKEGEATLLINGDRDGIHVDGIRFYTWTTENGQSYLEFDPYYFDGIQDGSTTSLLEGQLDARGMPSEPLDIDGLPHQVLEISWLADRTPDIIPQHTEGLQLVVPASMAIDGGVATRYPTFTAAFDVESGADHGEVTEAIEESFTTFDHSFEGVEPEFYFVTDYLEQDESTQTIAFIVNVFCLLFTGILTLIAMANVFNTITNGLILRRREFAVMKSIGLSNRQFRALIADECVNYGLRGLIPGLLLSVVVAYALFMVIGFTMEGGMFTLPWDYMAIAVGITALAMLVSVAYGMHRCKAENVVEALR